jgi:hypothetical protein
MEISYFASALTCVNYNPAENGMHIKYWWESQKERDH